MIMRRIKKIRWAPLLFTVLFFSITTSIFVGLTAANNIASSADAGIQELGISLADKTPAECASLGLTDVLVVTSSSLFSPFTGTSASELILGTAGADYIDGGGGNDCILGGGGDDGRQICILWFCFDFGLEGGDGNDVIIGGPGTDICLGDGGTDTFYQCETEEQ